jgi:hypothetical protein
MRRAKKLDLCVVEMGRDVSVRTQEDPSRREQQLWRCQKERERCESALLRVDEKLQTSSIVF